MANTLSSLSVAFFIAAGVCFLIAVVLFFVLNIPTVIGDLSGFTARKSIKNTRAQNEKSGNKSFRPSQTNAERGKLTSTMQPEKTGHVQKNKAGTAKKASPAKGKKKEEIVETGLLVETRNIMPDSEETALLSPFEQGAYGQSGAYQPPAAPTIGVRLEMLDEVILIHTEEKIVI